ncbi:MAG: hypothetical protein ACOH2S_14845, partial [Janthinobacterium svalbardensis]
YRVARTAGKMALGGRTHTHLLEIYSAVLLGALNQCFPKEIQAVANALNSRPRKALGWKSQAEVLDEYLKFVQQSSVARTG